jgi:hypothetical protein
MTSSKKGLSEPSWVGKVKVYTESGDLRSQDDCHGTAERLEVSIVNPL